MLSTALFIIVFLFIQMLVVWLIYLYSKNPGIVLMLRRPIGLMIAGITFLHADISTRTVITSVLLIIWGTRLAVYLWYTRIRAHVIEKRYLQISADWKISQSLGFFLNYQLQGLLIFAIALVFYPVASISASPLFWLDYIAIIIIMTGIIGESIADYQLYQFRKNQSGKVCEAGLWRYSRHPNYFCDWLVWLGFFLLGVQSNVFYVGMIAPILLYCIFNYVTGPITERVQLNPEERHS